MCHDERSTLSVPWWPAVNTNPSLQTLGGANPSLLKGFIIFVMEISIKARFQEVVYTVFSRYARFTLLPPSEMFHWRSGETCLLLKRAGDRVFAETCGTRAFLGRRFGVFFQLDFLQASSTLYPPLLDMLEFF